MAGAELKQPLQRVREALGVDRIATLAHDIDHTSITWPGTNERCSVLVLSCSDIQRSHFDALALWHKQFGTYQVSPISQAYFREEERVQMLWRALLEPGTDNPTSKLFRTPDELRRATTPDEREYFMLKYAELREEATKDWAPEEEEAEEEDTPST